MPRTGPRLSTAIVFAVLFLGSCAKEKSTPVTPPVTGAPRASSPSEALRRLEFAYDHRDDVVNRDLFTSDFEFVFVPGDSAGIPYAVTPWNRTDELASFTKLVHGGTVDQPASSAIQLALDGTFTVADDPRPGKNARWHKKIRSNVVLIVNFTTSYTADITGASDFFFVRGDSAAIPGDLGVGPDSTLWYVDRWEDETGPVIGPTPHGLFPITPARAMPVTNNTWGRLKATYR